MNPHNTIFDAKRLIGRKFSDETVQKDMTHWPFKVINDGGKPKIEVDFKFEKDSYKFVGLLAIIAGIGFIYTCVRLVSPFLKKMGRPRPLFVYFWSFQTNNTIPSTINV